MAFSGEIPPAGGAPGAPISEKDRADLNRIAGPGEVAKHG